ncbi:hypothetical protein CFOL_v3_16372, partial [Cephalotus follicularis]
WFIDWWCFYGPRDEILPDSIYEALITFSNNTDKIPHCPTMIRFFIHAKLSWIMYWDNTISQPQNYLSALLRNFWTKWWNNYDLTKCTSQTILHSLRAKVQQDHQFTLTKSQIQTSIASSSTKQELQAQIKKLQEALANTPYDDSDKESIHSVASLMASIHLADNDDFIPIPQKSNGKENITKTGKKINHCH